MRVVVIGAGISGLSTAYRIQGALAAEGEPAELTVLEAGPSLGGTVGSAGDDGWVAEGGPNGFLDSKPATVDLVRDLGLEGKMIRADDASKIRYLFVDGKLVALPSSPPAFLTTPLLPFGAKLRVLLEPFKGKGPADESLADFGRRRLGPKMVQRMLDPFVSGVHAGDVERLSVTSAFPSIKALEMEHGGLFRGMFAKAREKKKRGDTKKAAGGPAGPGGSLHSMDKGMGQLIAGIAEAIDGEVRTGAPVKSVHERPGGGFQVRLDSGETLDCDAVVSSAPAHAARRFLATVDEDLGAALGEIPYAAVSVVATGFKRERLDHPLHGFGFLVPSGEGRDVLGVLWSSSIYPGHRAPEGHVLLRTMVGGARRPDLAALPDDQLVAKVRAEHQATMGITWDEPEFLRIFRWEKAIPQYVVGHGTRVRRVEAAESRHPGLFVTGNALRGIGLNDCTADAVRTARLVAELARGGVEGSAGGPGADAGLESGAAPV